MERVCKPVRYARAILERSQHHTRDASLLATKSEGIDFSPEGGAGVAAVKLLMDRGMLAPGDETVVFNTGAGWLYR